MIVFVTMRTPSWGVFFERALLIFILPFECKIPSVLWMYDSNVIFIIQPNFQPLLFNLWMDLEDFYPTLFSFYSFVYHSNLNVVGWWLTQNLDSLFHELSSLKFFTLKITKSNISTSDNIYVGWLGVHMGIREELTFLSSVQLLSHVWLFVTPWTAARQASLSITNSWSLPTLMSIESVMPSNHFILCCPLLFLPSIFPSIRVFSNKSALHIRWPKYWSFSFNITFLLTTIWE